MNRNISGPPPQNKVDIGHPTVGTYKVRNEIETKRNQLKRNETKRNEINKNETKRNQQKRNETKRNQRNENEIKRNQRNQRKQNEIRC